MRIPSGTATWVSGEISAWTGCGRQLGLDGGRGGGVEKPGVGQLPQAGEVEREPEQRPQWEEHAARRLPGCW